MHSGRTHDSITLWSLLPVTGCAYLVSQKPTVTLLLAGGYLFGGLMFGPDLDTHSCQYRRWGALRWGWLPYRRAMRHRSQWSHGMLIGTVGRLFYLLSLVSCGALLALLLWEIVLWLGDRPSHTTTIAHQMLETSLVWFSTSVQTYPGEWLGAFLGLELGAMSHSLSDWIVSTVKRRQRSKRR